MKKILSILVCLSLILVVSGCAKIEETWKDITGVSDSEIDWDSIRYDSEVSTDGSGVIEEENSVKYVDDTELEIPEYKSNAIEFTVNDARFGSRNMTTRYENVNLDYEKFVDGIVELKDSISDDEMIVASKNLAKLLNNNLNMGLVIETEGVLKEISDGRKDICFEELGNYSIRVTNSETFQSSVSLECLPMNLRTKSDVYEYLKPFGEKLGIDLFEDSSFVEALNGITYEVPIGDNESKEYNHLYINIFDNSIDKEVLIINIIGKKDITVDGEVFYYSVDLTVKLSQPRYEEIKSNSKN